VAVRVPASASARVDLRSTSGRLRSGFDAVSSAPGAGPAVMSGILGSGSASISLTSMAGDVTLLARAGDPRAGAAEAEERSVTDSPASAPTGQGDQT